MYINITVHIGLYLHSVQMHYIHIHIKTYKHFYNVRILYAYSINVHITCI